MCRNNCVGILVDFSSAPNFVHTKKQGMKALITMVILYGLQTIALAQFESTTPDSLNADSVPPMPETEMEDPTVKDSVMYTANYLFKDGFYYTRNDFMHGHPITIDKVLSTVPITDPNFYAKVLQTGSFQVNVDDGTFKYVNVEDIFGFVQNRILYLNMGPYGFVRITNIGRICYVSVGREAPKVRPSVGVGMSSWGGAGVGVGVSIGGGSTITEYIFKLSGGPMVELTPEMLLEFIKDDEIIFNNYVSLNKRYRMKEMHSTLHEYNRRNPLYLPNN